MELKALRNIEAEEIEMAKDDANRALEFWRNCDEKNIKILLQLIYGVKDNNFPTSFVNTGNVKEIAMYSKPIVTIFPFSDERDLRRCYKITSKELTHLVKAGIIFPLIQPASRYEKLHYLHPIIEEKPKDYFSRSVYFYSIFFDDTIELETVGRLKLSPTLVRLYEKAKNCKVLKRIILDEYKDSRELYDRGNIQSHAEKKTRLEENISYRYASVASFIGESAVDFILDSLNPHESMNVLLHLHTLTDHIYTQGILNNMHDQEYSYLPDTYHKTHYFTDWLTNALDPWADVLMDRTPINTIPLLTAREILKFHEEGLPLYIPHNLGSLKELKATLDLNIEEINYRLESLATTKGRTKKYVTVTLFILSGMLGKFSLTAGAASLLGGLILPPKILDMIFEGMTNKIKEKMARGAIKYMHTIWTYAPHKLNQVGRR
jgi:hypothetical protein